MCLLMRNTTAYLDMNFSLWGEKKEEESQSGAVSDVVYDMLSDYTPSQAPSKVKSLHVVFVHLTQRNGKLHYIETQTVCGCVGD